MKEKLPKNCLVVVATGAEANLYRNEGDPGEIRLKATGALTPRNLVNEGPSGSRPPESSPRETDEATFSKQLAETLYQQAHSGDYSHLALVADPQTLGELRPLLHKEVTDKIVLEVNKTLINSPLDDIEKILSGC
jgi:protein required for attachment to host cells